MDAAIGCPRGKSGEIVVCRRGDRNERYRIPETMRPNGFDPGGSIDSVSRERHRLIEAGDSGTGSCSTSGAGGWTGCLSKEWRAKREQYGR